MLHRRTGFSRSAGRSSRRRGRRPAYSYTYRRKYRIHRLRFGISLTLIAALVISLLWIFIVPLFRHTERGAALDPFGYALWTKTDLRTKENGRAAAQTLLIVRERDDRVFFAAAPDKKIVPASIAKLFVLDYALTILDLNEKITPTKEALAMVKPGSSVAWLEPREYTVKDLTAALLLPSGNDAAYALADACGARLQNDAAPGEERVAVFLDGLKKHLAKRGFTSTVIFDPSGYDYEARTDGRDVVRVMEDLRLRPEVRELLGAFSYRCVREDGGVQEWQSTNVFLDSQGQLYDPFVKGGKTGSLEESNSIIVAVEIDGETYYICGMGYRSTGKRTREMTMLLHRLEADMGVWSSSIALMPAAMPVLS